MNGELHDPKFGRIPKRDRRASSTGDDHEERQNEEILSVLDHGESSLISRGYVQVLCFSMMDQRIVSKKEYCSSAVKSVMNCMTIEIVTTFCCLLCTVFMNSTQKREISEFSLV
jgi:hypothetical protein